MANTTKKWKGKSKKDIAEQKKQMQETMEHEQDLIWYEEETLKRFLKFAATFCQYSYNNQLLLHAQFPNATMVGTYGKWQKAGREIIPGERKNYIELFAPKPSKRWVENDVIDDDGNYVLNADGTRKKEKTLVDYMDYRAIYVYDVSQTEGDRLPELSHEGEDPLYETDEDLYEALKSICNVTEQMTASDMIHFVSQEFLKKKYATYEPHETEACAYILSSYLQMDAHDYHTDSVFRWANGKDRKEIAACMNRVQKVSKEIIQELEDTVCIA